MRITRLEILPILSNTIRGGGGKSYGVCVTRYAVRPRPELEFDAKAHGNEDVPGSTIESILSPPGLSLYPPWPLG